MRRKPYRPVAVNSAIGRTLTFLQWLITVTIPKVERPNGMESAWELAASNVERTWGERPEMHRRHTMSQSTGGMPFLVFFISIILLFALLLGSTPLGVPALAHVGVWISALGSLGFGLFVGLLRRTTAEHLDYIRWTRAGRPEEWVPRASSQPRNSDLALALIVAIPAASLFVYAMYR